jgi:hypothetical protein
MKTLARTLFILALFLFSFCNYNTSGNDAQQIAAASNFSSSNIPQWHFVTKEDTLGNPQTTVYLVVRDTQKIAQELPHLGYSNNLNMRTGIYHRMQNQLALAFGQVLIIYLLLSIQLIHGS